MGVFFGENWPGAWGVGEPARTPCPRDKYYELRKGLGGFNKSPAVYGAFPADPYSHTPAHAGAKQPGMARTAQEAGNPVGGRNGLFPFSPPAGGRKGSAILTTPIKIAKKNSGFWPKKLGQKSQDFCTFDAV